MFCASRSFIVLFSSSYFCPIIRLVHIFFISATPSVKYGSRNNSGEVVFTFNPSGTDPQQIIRQHTPASGLTVEHAKQNMALQKGYKYMFQKQTDKAAGK